MKQKLVIIIFSMIILVGGLSFFSLSNNSSGLSSPVFFIANAGDGTISEVDFQRSETVQSISVGSEQLSHGIAISPDEQTVYFGTGSQDSSLQAYDLESNQVTKKLSFNEGGLHGIDIHPSGEFIYISISPGLGEEGGQLAIVDTNSFETVAMIETDDGPSHVSVTNNGEQVWVANVNGNTVSVVDAYTFQLLANIPVGEMPNEVTVSPTHDFAYAANVASNTLSVIDMNTFDVIEEIAVGDGVHGVTVSADGSQVWTANNNSNDVSVVDVATLSVIETIESGSYPNHISFSPEGDLAFVTHRESNSIVVIDKLNYSVLEEFEVGSQPHEMTLKGMSGSIEVSEPSENSFIRRSATSGANGVEVEAQLLSPFEQEDITYIKDLIDVNPYDYFSIKLNLTTHSGDLTGIPFEENLVLANNQGIELEVAEWIEVSSDSHHPEYVALFEKTVDKNVFLANQGSQFTLLFQPFIGDNDSLEMKLN